MTYGFTILDNKYDSYEFYINRCLADVKDFNKFEEQGLAVENKCIITFKDYLAFEGIENPFKQTIRGKN